MFTHLTHPQASLPAVHHPTPADLLPPPPTSPVLVLPRQVDEQLYRLQFERADLLKRIDEDQDDLNDLMQKHKDLIAQVAASGRRMLAALGGWVRTQSGHSLVSGPWRINHKGKQESRLTLTFVQDGHLFV